MLAMLAAFLPNGGLVKAADMKEVEIGAVEDITTATLVKGATSDSLDTVFSFTLQKPAVVKASASQTISSEPYRLTAGVYADSNGTALVTNGELRRTQPSGVYNTSVDAEGVDGIMWLEAGTYYIIINHEDADPELVNEGGVASVGVCCEYVDRTCTGNNSFQKAGKININDDVTGFLSSTSRKQYYKFILTKPSTVEISSVASTNERISSGSYRNSEYKLSLCNSKYREITVRETDLDGSAEIISAKLNKGTYYIALDATKYQNFVGANTLRVDAKALPKPATPKVKKAAANASSIKGKTTANAVVYVSYSGKTYKASATAGGSFTVKTPKLKKGKSVKVYAVKDYVKSNVRTIKVK